MSSPVQKVISDALLFPKCHHSKCITDFWYVKTKKIPAEPPLPFLELSYLNNCVLILLYIVFYVIICTFHVTLKIIVGNFGNLNSFYFKFILLVSAYLLHNSDDSLQGHRSLSVNFCLRSQTPQLELISTFLLRKPACHPFDLSPKHHTTPERD